MGEGKGRREEKGYKANATNGDRDVVPIQKGSWNAAYVGLRGEEYIEREREIEKEKAREKNSENLNLYLDLSKEKGCKMCRIWWIRDQLCGSEGKRNFTMAWRIPRRLAERYVNVNFMIKVAD